MSYFRVVPRDFFNEAKLLKCLGQFELLCNHKSNPLGIETSHDEQEGEFQVVQNQMDGSLSVLNYSAFLHGDEIQLFTPYNSKSPYPLYGAFRGNVYGVFDEEGNWSTEFIETLKLGVKNVRSSSST